MTVGVERDVTGAVPGHVDDVERDPRDRDLVAAADRVLRVVRRDAHAAARLARLQRVDLAARRPDLGAGSLGERRDAADVVDVGVRDEDPGGARAHAGELEPERRRVVARIDHRRLRRAALGADDVAVRLERSHHEAVDDERHEERLSVGVYASAVQRWDLTRARRAERHPRSDRPALRRRRPCGADRAQPGQELGEHQVKENAWVTVIDGEVDVECGGGTVSGGPGTFMRFDPGERHTAAQRERRTRAAAALAVARRRPLLGRRALALLRGRPAWPARFRSMRYFVRSSQYVSGTNIAP